MPSYTKNAIKRKVSETAQVQPYGRVSFGITMALLFSTESVAGELPKQQAQLPCPPSLALQSGNCTQDVNDDAMIRADYAGTFVSYS